MTLRRTPGRGLPEQSRGPAPNVPWDTGAGATSAVPGYQVTVARGGFQYDLGRRN